MINQKQKRETKKNFRWPTFLEGHNFDHLLKELSL